LNADGTTVVEHRKVNVASAPVQFVPVVASGDVKVGQAVSIFIKG